MEKGIRDRDRDGDGDEDKARGHGAALAVWFTLLEASAPQFCISGTAARRDPALGQKFILCKAALHTNFGPSTPNVSAAVLLLSTA